MHFLLTFSWKHYYDDRFEAAQVQSRFFSSFQTHFVQLTKPSQVLVRPTGIQALPSPVNSIIIMIEKQYRGGSSKGSMEPLFLPVTDP